MPTKGNITTNKRPHIKGHGHYTNTIGTTK